MPIVTVRFRGICCFIDPPNGEKKIFTKRVVLPNGSNHEHAGIEKHLPIIEFFADDLKRKPSGMELFDFTRPGDDGMYQYIQITEPVSITLSGTSKGSVDKGLNFNASVIGLDTLVPKPGVLKKSLLGEAVDVDSELVTAVMDLPGGELRSGPPEATVTTFPMSPKFTNRRVGRWLEHTVDVPGDEICLELAPLGKPNATPKKIVFKSTTRLITIANEPLRLIVGKFVQKSNGETEGLTPGHSMKKTRKKSGAKKAKNGKPQAAHQAMQSANGGQQGTAHFSLYWDLMADPPKVRPLPGPSQGSGPSCTPATKP